MCVFAPAIDLPVPGLAIKADRLVLVDAGLEAQPAGAKLPSGGFEVMQNRLRDATPAQFGLDVHAFHLAGGFVQPPDRAAADRPPVHARHEERSDPCTQLLRLEIRSESLLGRIATGEVQVESRDQAPGVARIERLAGDGDLHRISSFLNAVWRQASVMANVLPVTSRRALVLGGGGVTGIAWETGLLAGLAEAGIDLTSADLVVGTSAGSVVGAQILSGVSIKDLYAEQLIEPRAEVAARMGATVTLRFAAAMLWPGGEEQARARLGRAALKARTVPESERKAIIKQRLPVDSWPERRLLITAVDAETGELRVFDRDGGVALLEAVPASCAVPLIWPPISIDGRRYIY